MSDHDTHHILTVEPRCPGQNAWCSTYLVWNTIPPTDIIFSFLINLILILMIQDSPTHALAWFFPCASP